MTLDNRTHDAAAGLEYAREKGMVRVGWNAAIYVDYLTYHRVDGDWLITAKGFHIERALAG